MPSLPRRPSLPGREREREGERGREREGEGGRERKGEGGKGREREGGEGRGRELGGELGGLCWKVKVESKRSGEAAMRSADVNEL